MPWDKPYRPHQNKRLAPELYRSAAHVCFVTIRAYANQSPFASHTLNQLILDVLHEEQERQNCAVFTYCLMPDHLHFLVSPRQDGVSVLTFAEQCKGKSTNRSWTVGWHGRLWQPRYYDHLVRAEEDLRAIAQYILDNPVRRGLVEVAEDWPWSGHMNPLPL
jgi:putative transposase